MGMYFEVFMYELHESHVHKCLNDTECTSAVHVHNQTNKEYVQCALGRGEGFLMSREIPLPDHDLYETCIV